MKMSDTAFLLRSILNGNFSTDFAREISLYISYSQNKDADASGIIEMLNQGMGERKY